MFRKITQSIIPIFLFLFTVLPVFAYTKYIPIEKITPGIASLPDFIKSVLDIAMKIGIPAGTMFIVWSGFLFVTAQGDPAGLKKAKDALFWSCIGLAVLLGSWLIATAIVGTITQIGGPVNPAA